MKKLTCLLLLSLLLMGTSAAFGADVLYWVDNTDDRDQMGEALNELSFGLDLTIAENAADFETQVTNQDWDLIVLGIHSEGVEADFSNFEDYVTNGGKAILCDWAIEPEYEKVLFSLFGANPTGNSNDISVTITSGDFASNPLELTNNLGWNIFSYGLSPVASSDIVLGTFDNGEAAIILSNGGKTIFNGFLYDTVSDDVLFVNEIRYLLPDLAADSASGGSGGCNMMALVPAGLLLLAPLALVLKKTR